MRKKLLVLLTAGLLLLTQSVFAVTATGINFRATAGYVSDAATDTYCLGDSTTRGGVTFSWDFAPPSRDRDNTVDPELAGVNFGNGGAVYTFTITLPAAGSYDIRLAVGDVSNGSTHQVTVKDNATTLFTVSGTTSAGHFLDAGGNDRTTAAWPGSNVANTQTFSTTTLKLLVDSNGGRTTEIAHVGFAAAGGGGATTPNTLSVLGVGK